MSKVVVIVPNWNGSGHLSACLDSLVKQSLKPHIIVVDNGSTDGSLERLKNYPEIEVIKHAKNRGYAGGVNPGFQRAIDLGATFAAPFNNDAVADEQWLEKLVNYLEAHETVGIAACKLLTSDGKRLDSSGDYYTVWGLPYPRGRSEAAIDAYDAHTDIFGASGGASLYRVAMLEEIGLLDEDFFAYYEDVDISFRAQLAGWKVAYVPEAIARHAIGGTSGRIKGFTTYQTVKNLPMLFIKNVPRQYLWRIGWRLLLAETLFLGRAVLSGHGWAALKGKLRCLYLFSANLNKRRRIQAAKKVSNEYIWSMLIHDLPPNARALRRLREAWWKLTRKKEST